MNIKNIILTSLFFLISGAAAGQANQTAVAGLRVEPDPISTGRGVTGVADASDANAVFWNPAGLGFSDESRLALSRFKWLPGLDDDLTYNYLSGSHFLDGIGTIGGHITYLDLGSQSFRDEQGNSGGSFSSYEFSMGVSIGRVAIPDQLSLGLGVRFISSRLAPSGVDIGGVETKTGNTFGVDLGALWDLGESSTFGKESTTRLGVSITNFGGRVSYSSSGVKESIPTLFRAGIFHRIDLDENAINTLTLTSDISKLLVRSDSSGAQNAFAALVTSWSGYQYFNGEKTSNVSLPEQLMIGLGVEYWYNAMLAVRAGYYNESKANGGRRFLTVGGSLHYAGIAFNASIAFQQGYSAVKNIVRLGVLVQL